VRWHRSYDVEGSPLRQRLAIVQRLVRDAIDAAPADGPVRILSLCAGRGTDVIEVLATHPRADSVEARLVESDPDLAARARSDAAAAGIDGLDVVTGDASVSDVAQGAVPADVLVACGIFGNVSDISWRPRQPCARRAPP
jgi:predicted RNA methylase